MKRSLVFVFLILIIAMQISCSIRYVSPVTQKKTADKDSIYVVGKISFSPELVQTFDGTSGAWKEGTAYIMFKKDAVQPCNNGFDSDLNAEYKWGEYFVWEIPRETLYLRTIMVPLSKKVNNSKILYVQQALPFDFSKDDSFVYIGDLTYVFDMKSGTNDHQLKVADSSDEVKKRFAGLVVNSDGSPVPLRLKNIKSGKVNAFIYDSTVRMQ
jgi:hypothetical protein